MWPKSLRPHQHITRLDRVHKLHLLADPHLKTCSVTRRSSTVTGEKVLTHTSSYTDTHTHSSKPPTTPQRLAFCFTQNNGPHRSSDKGKHTSRSAHFPPLQFTLKEFFTIEQAWTTAASPNADFNICAYNITFIFTSPLWNPMHAIQNDPHLSDVDENKQMCRAETITTSFDAADQ